MPQSASSNVNSPQTARDEVAGTPVTKQHLQTLHRLLQTACGRGCPCLILPQCVSAASSWDAAQPGYSKVHTDLFGVLPQLPAVLLKGNHARSARHAVLTLYNMLVVSPLCIKLSSPDAAVAAAARAEALAAVLAATKSGLVKHLQGEATCATFAYTAIYAQLHGARLLPGYENEGEMKQELAGIMSRTQLTCCWVTALARIWPGSMLAAPGGAGSMAGEVLQVCGRYFGYLQAVQQHNNQTPAARQRLQQQEQQLGLMQLPADDVTAAVVHTASLLLQDLDRHMQQRDRQQLQELHPLQQQQRRQRQQHKQPEAVQGLLSQGGELLLHAAVPLAVIYGNQLRLHLQHELQHQRQQQQQAVPRQQDTTDSSSSNNSSSSRSAAEQAEGVLLCRADMLQSDQLQQLPSNPAVVHSWGQHFERSWSAQWPPHLLLAVPSAVAAAADTSSSNDTLNGQRYTYLLPEQCLVDAAAADAASSSSSRACCDVRTCLAVVGAAVVVLRHCLAQVESPDFDIGKAVQQNPAFAKSPALLLCCAVATLRLSAGGNALFNAMGCCELAVNLSKSAGSGTATQAAAGASASASDLWATLGLATLVSRQFMCVVDAAAAAAAAVAATAGNSSSSSSVGSAAAGGSMSVHPLVVHVAALRAAAMSLNQVLSCAVQQQSPSTGLTPSEQLQQASFTVQVMEAVLRCYARLLAEPSGVAADAASRIFTAQDMSRRCTSIVSRACHLVTTGLDSRADGNEQQVLLACVSALLAAVSTPQAGMGTPLISMLDLSAHLFMSVQLASPDAHYDELPAVACLHLMGRCLIAIAEQLQHAARHSFYDWVSLVLLRTDLGVPGSGRVVAANAQELIRTVQRVQGIVEMSCKLIVDNLLGRFEEWGWCAPTASSSSSSAGQDVLTRVCAALSGALRSGQLAQHTASRELLEQYHWATHSFAANRELSKVLQQFASVVLDNVHVFQQQQQQQGQQQHQQGQLQQGLRRAVREGQVRAALEGLALGFAAGGGALCAAMPNHFFCNNPGCRSTAGVSAGFALVRGEGVVCGGCVGPAHRAATPVGLVVAAARYCSVACQQQHFACHKACYHSAVLGDAGELEGRVMRAAYDVGATSTAGAHSFCSCCSFAAP